MLKQIKCGKSITIGLKKVHFGDTTLIFKQFLGTRGIRRLRIDRKRHSITFDSNKNAKNCSIEINYEAKMGIFGIITPMKGMFMCNYSIFLHFFASMSVYATFICVDLSHFYNFS